MAMKLGSTKEGKFLTRQIKPHQLLKEDFNFGDISLTNHQA
jgi:hypothetical protein